MSDALVPLPVCAKCGPGPELEGPYERVWFCRGCGRSVRMGETAYDLHLEKRRDAELAKARHERMARIRHRPRASAPMASTRDLARDLTRGTPSVD